PIGIISLIGIAGNKQTHLPTTPGGHPVLRPLEPVTKMTSPTTPTHRALALGVAGVLAAVCLAGCGSNKQAAATTTAAGPTTTSAPTTIRVGYFPNITHAPALVGVNQGIFQKDLGADTLDASKTFNAGPAEVEALLSGAIDAAFIGPGPAVN